MQIPQTQVADLVSDNFRDGWIMLLLGVILQLVAYFFAFKSVHTQKPSIGTNSIINSKNTGKSKYFPKILPLKKARAPAPLILTASKKDPRFL